MTRARTDRFILTAFFLDQPLAGLEALSGDDWIHNRPHVEGEDTIERLISVYAPLAEQVSKTLAGGERPVTISGDCCSSLAVLAGLQRMGLDPTLIWLDAHGDFNTPETSPSGFLGGMPLAMLVGRGDPRPAQGLGLCPPPEERVILSDARDLDSLERPAVESSGVRHLTRVTDVPRAVPPEGPLYVHFDTDVVNAEEVPAQNYPASGGSSSKEIAEVFRAIAATRRVVAVSVSTWNPDLDRDGSSRRVSMRLLGVLLGLSED